ncbi:gluconolactonase [Alsobacter metallidurans]|uniref:Gluconolactonase n=1 Tax=Alsobacter metallidurans TaxID=340221 RepID=A0A917I4L1_9HYPH|nr:SMP-30/gluconolactonase/LRE family protein [Alsobacter metallidurans]GGH14170.1 gluconolactonase [Alsobacter metallidurans]
MTKEILDPAYEVLDPRAKGLFNKTAKLERLYEGCRWAEGPAYFPAGRYLIWSDIPNNRIMRYDETDGSVSVFREPSNNTNGHTVDREGRLVSCEHLGRRVSRTEHDGSITVLADRWNGKRLNSPNDVVVKSDGSIWFTDPAYGIDWDYEGARAESEIGACNVYRIDPASGAVDLVADDFKRPNGLAFSPDESKLYIADTGASHFENGPRHIRVFNVEGGRTLKGGEIFATCTNGMFDGFRCDEDGRIWTSAADGVHVYDPDGTMIARVHVPEIVANVCFGALRRNRLYICGTTSLYAYYVLVRGAKTF